MRSLSIIFSRHSRCCPSHSYPRPHQFELCSFYVSVVFLLGLYSIIPYVFTHPISTPCPPHCPYLPRASIICPIFESSQYRQTTTNETPLAPWRCHSLEVDPGRCHPNAADSGRYLHAHILFALNLEATPRDNNKAMQRDMMRMR